MTTSNKTKQFAVHDSKNNRWYIRIGDRVQWHGAEYTLTAFSASATKSSGGVALHLRETRGNRYTYYANSTENFNLVRRAGTTKTTKTTKVIKFIPALALGGGTLWLTVGEKYRVYLRNKSSTQRFGVVDLHSAKLESIDEEEGYHNLRMHHDGYSSRDGCYYKGGNTTIATIANPALTKIGLQWERYFEKV